MFFDPYPFLGSFGMKGEFYRPLRITRKKFGFVTGKPVETGHIIGRWRRVSHECRQTEIPKDGKDQGCRRHVPTGKDPLPTEPHESVPVPLDESGKHAKKNRKVMIVFVDIPTIRLPTEQFLEPFQLLVPFPADRAWGQVSGKQPYQETEPAIQHAVVHLLAGTDEPGEFEMDIDRDTGSRECGCVRNGNTIRHHRHPVKLTGLREWQNIRCRIAKTVVIGGNDVSVAINQGCLFFHRNTDDH